MSGVKLGKTELWLAIVAFAAALAIRILPFTEEVFQADVVMPWGCPDVYYHLHRIIVGARYWPRFPEFDLWRNYPDGAYSIWTPLFDAVPAAFAAVTGMRPIAVGVVWPALLGALAVFPLLDVLHRLHGRVAWLGVALFLVLPGSLSFAYLGRTDHHVGEVLMQLWVYALVLRSLPALQHAAGPPIRSTLWLGVVAGLSLWMWRGSVVILLPVSGTALLMAAGLREPEQRRATARHFALAFGVAALVALPYGVLNVARGRDPFAAYFLSLLQPAILLSWALLMPVARQLGDTGLRIAPFLQPRNALALGASVAILALGIDGMRAGTAFLSRVGDSWAATIMESQPAWAGGLPTRFAIEEVGFLPLLIVPLLLGQLARMLRTWPAAPAALFVALAALVSIALACLQVRFVYYAAPVVVAAPGALWHACRGHRGRQLAATALALALLWPVTRYYTPLFDGDPRTQMSPLPLNPKLTMLMADLHRHSPHAGDPYRPDVRPAYCVLAPWDLGNFIQTMAKRPVLASSGGPHETAAYHDTVAFLNELKLESKAAALMTRRGCRYVITQRAGGTGPGADLQVFARRLHLARGSDFDSQLGAHEGSGRFRFRFESRDSSKHAIAMYRGFELVPGAVLRFPAGTAVEIQTRVPSEYAPFFYRRRLSSAGARAVETRVSQPGEYDVLDARRAVLGKVQVSEPAVMQGKTLVFAAQ